MTWRGLHLYPRVELWSAMAAIVWAKALWWTGSTLVGNPSYRFVLDIMDTDWWEGVVFACGCAQLAAVLLGCRWARVVAATAAAWMFLCLGLLFATTDSGAPGWALYLAFGLGNVHSMVSGMFRPWRRA